ncbi:MAG: hypothetical protein JXA78_03260 [Anaerolineales bacterium]|nr:hypothetical protein [Anaerolineales bacterium]
MLLAPLRWLARNLSTLVLAFVLAVVVWVSAVVTADPNQEDVFQAAPIEQVGQNPGLLLVGDIPTQAYLTLNAPRSIWERLNNDPGLVEAWIDLSGLGPGEHTVEVKAYVDINPVRLIKVDPQTIHLTLEPLSQQDFSVQLTVSGDLPLGYKKGAPLVTPQLVTVSGPKSAVERVSQARVSLDISGAIETIQQDIPVEIVDDNGEPVSNLTVSPRLVTVTHPISLLGGFKNVAVKVVTEGQVANGYRLTNILVSPPTVTLFSDDPRLINEIPGFVETLPVNLENLNDDVEISVNLNLPEGITSVREPVVLVQVGVAAIEGSLTLSVPVEMIGLSPDLQAIISPDSVDVIVAGPLYVLDALTPSNFRVVLDLAGLPVGVYQRVPVVASDSEQVRVQTTLPETVEVRIELAPTPTLTLTLSVTPEVSLTPTQAPTVTPQP